MIYVVTVKSKFNGKYRKSGIVVSADDEQIAVECALKDARVGFKGHSDIRFVACRPYTIDDEEQRQENYDRVFRALNYSRDKGILTELEYSIAHSLINEIYNSENVALLYDRWVGEG